MKFSLTTRVQHRPTQWFKIQHLFNRSRAMSLVQLTVLLCSCWSTAKAQNDVLVTQYQHNQFAINSAFAGSREGLTLFGSYRTQWTGLNGAPTSQLFTAHAPLINPQMAIGIQVYNQRYSVAGNSGFAATYAYRVPTSENTWLSFGISPGVSLRSARWTDIDLIEPGDEAFSDNEKLVSPLLGLGIAWYSNKFFAGFSIPSLITANEFQGQSATFGLKSAAYQFTAGYAWPIGNQWTIQPSVFYRYQTITQSIADLQATLMYRNLVWVGMSYRSTNELAITGTVFVVPQFRISYSYDYHMGNLKTYQSGSHEISLQYDFVYKSASHHPKFF